MILDNRKLLIKTTDNSCIEYKQPFFIHFVLKIAILRMVNLSENFSALISYYGALIRQQKTLVRNHNCRPRSTTSFPMTARLVGYSIIY